MVLPDLQGLQPPPPLAFTPMFDQRRTNSTEIIIVASPIHYTVAVAAPGYSGPESRPDPLQLTALPQTL